MFHNLAECHMLFLIFQGHLRSWKFKNSNDCMWSKHRNDTALSPSCRLFLRFFSETSLNDPMLVNNTCNSDKPLLNDDAP